MPHLSGTNSTLHARPSVASAPTKFDANGKIGLSVKKLQQERAKKPSMSSPAEYFKAPAPKDQSFEDMMTRFKSISDDKMSDLKRGKDFKRRSSRKGK